MLDENGSVAEAILTGRDDDEGSRLDRLGLVAGVLPVAEPQDGEPKRRGRPPKAKEIDPEKALRRERIAVLHGQGKTRQEIVDETGYRKAVVHGVLMGITYSGRTKKRRKKKEAAEIVGQAPTLPLPNILEVTLPSGGRASVRIEGGGESRTNDYKLLSRIFSSMAGIDPQRGW